jgi:hypothetical protein
VLKNRPFNRDDKTTNVNTEMRKLFVTVTAAIEAGMFDDGILALLQKKKAEWRVVVYDIASIDGLAREVRRTARPLSMSIDFK